MPDRTLERRDSLSLPSRETSPTTPSVPDQDTAAVISGLIDRARMAMGWNRLSQSRVTGENSEQDVAIITWFEICADAGMRLEQYAPCYRAAQQRKRELLSQGQPLSIVTPHDLCAELDRVRAMHAELDKTRMLPSRARGACSRCFGTGFERMPNGSVRPGCKHDEWTDVDESELERNEEQVRAEVARQAEIMREALKKVGSPKPVETEVPAALPAGHWLKCDKCPNRVNVLHYEEDQRCGYLLNRYTSDEGEPTLCEGILKPE
jgi:hypothetical protein